MTQHTFIIGGQKSGKTAYAEKQAAHWLQQSKDHQAIYCATAIAHDDEMRMRIARHQHERQQRVPAMQTVELAHLPQTDLAAWLRSQNNPDVAIVLDCMSMWLAYVSMSVDKNGFTSPEEAITNLFDALQHCPAKLYIVGNEIGLGVIPMGEETRAFVDALGNLNQGIAAICAHVTLMCAGLPLELKK